MSLVKIESISVLISSFVLKSYCLWVGKLGYIEKHCRNCNVELSVTLVKVQDHSLVQNLRLNFHRKSA